MTDLTDRQPARGLRERLRLPVVSVRARILSWIILTTATGIGLAGAFWFVLELDRLDARVTAALQQEIEELELFAHQGVDPDTGEPFASVERLFVVSADREVPELHQSFAGIVGGREVASASSANIRLSDHPDLLQSVEAQAASGDVVLREATIDGDAAMLMAVQVVFEAEGVPGTYLVAYDIQEAQGEVLTSIRTFGIVAAGAMLVVSVVGWLVAGRLLEPIRLLRRTAQRINDTDITDRIVVSGHDDVSDLARTFNAMLDRLQTAFETQRSFLDDAGHELRTPLTIVRGHLELLDPTDADDTQETRQLVLDEVDRMQRLVDELLLLAKSRRPDFVAAAPLDVRELVTAVVDKARPLGDRAWQVDRSGPGTVVGDEQRLTQALLQLVANAVKFSDTGDVVAIGGEVRGGVARLWVRDTGPGVAPEDQQRIFERFGRAATGRGVEGSGLGLAIVSAIAAAHGGTVELDSAVGRGATFTLVIPAAPPRPDDGAELGGPAGSPGTSETSDEHERPLTVTSSTRD